MLRNLLYLAADGEFSLDDAIEPYVDFWILIGMFMALMLPIFAIPWLFIKMGSVAGRIQAKMNSSARGARNAATGLAKREAKGAAGRAWERKAGEWAKNGEQRAAAGGKRGLRGTVGGYKTQRDFRRSQGSAEAKRMQEDALATRIDRDQRYRDASGGAHASAVAQAIQDKRLKEETDNASAQLRGAGIYNPQKLAEVAAGSDSVVGTKVGADGRAATVNASGEGGRALQRAAMQQLIAAQDSESLNKLVSTDHVDEEKDPNTGRVIKRTEYKNADKQMLYEEIQKQYSTAKGAGAHFVAFSPKNAGDGWSQTQIQEQAAQAVSKLAPEKLVQQDGGTMKAALQGVQAKVTTLQTLQATTGRTAEQNEQLKALTSELGSLAKSIASVKGNINTYNAAKQPVRDAIDSLHGIDALRNLAPAAAPSGGGTPPAQPPLPPGAAGGQSGSVGPSGFWTPQPPQTPPQGGGSVQEERARGGNFNGPRDSNNP